MLLTIGAFIAGIFALKYFGFGITPLGLGVVAVLGLLVWYFG